MRSDPRHQAVRTGTRLIGYPLGYPRAAFGPKVILYSYSLHSLYYIIFAHV